MRKRDLKFKTLSAYVLYREKYIKDNANVRECGLRYADDGLILTIMEGFTE